MVSKNLSVTDLGHVTNNYLAFQRATFTSVFGSMGIITWELQGVKEKFTFFFKS